MDQLTPIGQALRKLRIEKRLKLLDMARDLAISSAYLSAIEMGRKRVPADLVDKVVGRYGLDPLVAGELKDAAQKSAKTLAINLNGTGDKTRDLALYLSRRFEELGDVEAEKILATLRSELEKGSGGR